MIQPTDGVTKQVRVTPHKVIEHTINRKEIAIEDLGVGETVVLSWGTKVVEWMADSLGAELSPNWLYGDREQLYTAEIDGQRVSIVRVPVGAPGTVMHMEEMIACGAKTFIGLGWAGSLLPEAPIGSLLIPTSCVRQEGTSPHYIEDESRIIPDPELVELLTLGAEVEGLDVHSGIQWTTDAPYREFLHQIETFRQGGVLGVDMETSAMYALGLFRNVRVANLLVVSDEVWHEWRPAFGTEELVRSTRDAQRIIERALEMLLAN